MTDGGCGGLNSSAAPTGRVHTCNYVSHAAMAAEVVRGLSLDSPTRGISTALGAAFASPDGVKASIDLGAFASFLAPRSADHLEHLREFFGRALLSKGLHTEERVSVERHRLAALSAYVTTKVTPTDISSRSAEHGTVHILDSLGTADELEVFLRECALHLESELSEAFVGYDTWREAWERDIAEREEALSHQFLFPEHERLLFLTVVLSVQDLFALKVFIDARAHMEAGTSLDLASRCDRVIYACLAGPAVAKGTGGSSAPRLECGALYYRGRRRGGAPIRCTRTGEHWRCGYHRSQEMFAVAASAGHADAVGPNEGINVCLACGTDAATTEYAACAGCRGRLHHACASMWFASVGADDSHLERLQI